MKKQPAFLKSLAATALGAAALALASPAQAAVINGSFENGFTGWTITGHPYLVTDNGGGRVRHNYLAYQGWEGADVWFSGSPQDGQSYAVLGSNGNESDGTLLGSGTASNQFLSFWHLGNNTSGNSAGQAFAELLDGFGNVLSTIWAPSYNDSVWRQYTFDLGTLGFSFGDSYSFRYVDGDSWSIIDNVNEHGPALASAAVPLPGTLALAGVAGLALLRSRRRTNVR